MRIKAAQKITVQPGKITKLKIPEGKRRTAYATPPFGVAYNQSTV